MVKADHSPTVDDEAFGNAGRAERHLHAAVAVGPKVDERIAVLTKEGSDVFGPVADRDSIDRHAAIAQRNQQGRFGNARHAPLAKMLTGAVAGERSVEEARLGGMPREAERGTAARHLYGRLSGGCDRRQVTAATSSGR